MEEVNMSYDITICEASEHGTQTLRWPPKDCPLPSVCVVFSSSLQERPVTYF